MFDELQDVYLPRLFKDAEKREIRFWVTGCSTGEEAYTLAILAREAARSSVGSAEMAGVAAVASSRLASMKVRMADKLA